MNIGDITLAGPSFYGYIYSIAKAIRHLGAETKVVTYDNYESGIISWPKRFLGVEWVEKQVHDSFFRRVMKKGSGSDWMMLLRGDLLRPEDLVTIKEQCHLRIALWVIDSVNSMKNGMELCRQSDVVFCYNREDQVLLSNQGKPALFTPLAYDPDYYHPLNNQEQDIDLYFVGALQPERLIMLNELCKQLDRYKIRIIVDAKMFSHYRFFTNHALRQTYPYLYRRVTDRVVGHHEINLLSNRARVCLNIMPQQATSGLNIRAYEICGSGAFQLINRNSVLNELFLENVEVATFSGMDELKEKVMYYLDRRNEAERGTLAVKGLKRAVADHTFDRRIEEMLRFLEDS